ncbi:Flp pilus assembly complex ATPase component TadA [Geomonas sp. Red32]|uniref:ATPase, T2SS/T4P/T4SS family n=1 Tax=Geomonas sp. Red32 TaxID=2912856 RepID=UPI00202CD3A4|nr:ATPase, T2SS/T4P/T4SS family [Geomonas sp. Red32]MCM0081023.1 Flp pilus assembly complex ATPase component TadA [Geomonas sp. Red32]
MNGLVKEGSIGAVLFKSQIITEQELRAALEAQKVSGCRIGEALVRLGVVTQEDIDWALANQLNIPYVRLKKENVDADAVARVPGALARRYQIFPVFLSGSELSVAMADPLNKEAIDELGRVTGCQVTISVGLIREIREMQDLFYPDQEVPALGFRSELFPPKAMEAINADLTGGTLLNHLLLMVVKQKLTTLALQPLGDEVSVVGRGGGRTAELGRLDAARYADLVARIRKLAKAAPAQEISSTGVLTFVYQGRKIPFQALLLHGIGGEYVTLKLKIAPPALSCFADLRVSDAKTQQLRELAAEREGLVLFAGRDPEERSRLMDLFLDEIDSSRRMVLVLGERLGRGNRHFPRIPLQRDGVDQSASVIAAALDHDPDVLFVDDITAPEAFLSASKAVMRGKLVVAGISFGDKGSLLKQLLYLRQKNYLIPTHLKGTVSCKSVLTLCPNCRERYLPAPEELAALRLPPSGREYFRPRGCPECDHTGYGGRRYLLDVIRFDKAFVEAFEMIGKSSEIIQYMKDNGYRGITEEGGDLLERGEISPGEYVASILL